MAILKSNLIEGRKPEIGNRNHIDFCRRIEGIMNKERPIVEDSDFEGVCDDGNNYMECARSCNCKTSQAKFNCIKCNKEHTVISSERIILSPVLCTCGITYSELHEGFINDWYLISDGSEDTIY
jgi:hypothetical protein